MYRIGIDLGGTNIAVGIVSEKGELLKKVSVPTNAEAGADAIIKKMAEAALELIKSENISEKEVVSIGIGFPGDKK